MEPRIVNTWYFNLYFEWLLGTRRVFNVDNTNTRRQLLKFGGCEAAINSTTNGIIAAKANILRRIAIIVAVRCSWPDMMYNLIFFDDAM